ncbi:MAG: biotin/lipoyl-binding protein, partial [Candidatus Acidoferrales bacterium]|nr:biotin/lipoyl-binding protein [Candidatus Acidoferrales bacterium]
EPFPPSFSQLNDVSTPAASPSTSQPISETAPDHRKTPVHDGAARKAPKRRFALLKKPVFWLLPVLFMAILAGGHWLRQRLTHVEENDARVEGEVITIASRVDGWLLTRLVMEGDRVHKGQVLGELDTRDTQLRLKTLEGSVAAHNAQIYETAIQHDTLQKTSDAQIANARAQLASAEAAAAVVEPQVEIARNDFARADSLVKTGAMSRQEWDHAHSALLQQTAALRQAQANIATQEASLTQATAQLGQVSMLEQQIEVLRGELAALVAQADQVRQEIADRTLRAPCDGIVDRTFIHAGDYVQAGQWLMMLHDPDDEWVEANVKETAVGRVRVGQSVSVTVDAHSPGAVIPNNFVGVSMEEQAMLPDANGKYYFDPENKPLRNTKPRQPAYKKESSRRFCPSGAGIIKLSS